MRDGMFTTAVEPRSASAILYRRGSSLRKLHDQARNDVAKSINLERGIARERADLRVSMRRHSRCTAPCPMSSLATFDTSLTVAYSRPVGDFALQDAQMESLRDRYDHRMRFERCAPFQARSKYRTWISTEHPMFLLLHGDQVVYAAIGRLPVREMRTLVERALRDQPVRALKCG